ncbi:MAG: DNA replication/repair protein RecF [Bacteroidales bacterium]|nr:DNA replication/repair protein RecF [Bacteroidales bacterium]
MHIASLKLANFKTYTDLDVEFCPNVNCLVGDNGVGKTNLLEAIYYLSFCKSFSSLPDTLNIRAGEDFFAIHGTYAIEGPESATTEEVKVSCVQKRGQSKQMLWGKKAYKTLGEHIGRIPLVMVSPADQAIINGGSDVRRKFLDGILSQVDHGYLNHLLQYQKALEQRNRLLKQMYEDRAWDEPAVALWDDQLVRHGQVLYDGRRAFLEEFKPLFDEYFSWITGNTSARTQGREEGRMEYVTRASFPLQQQLDEARQADKYAQYTTVGPHKDDLELSIGDFSVKRFGSQGQQKTFALAMKLAQFEYIYRHCGRKPILLLDDIFDKLDLGRVTQLVHLVGSDRFGQVFLTDTQPGRVQQIFQQIPQVEHMIFTVTPGTLNVQ